MAKGDKVTIGVRNGDGLWPSVVAATQNGRRVEHAFETEAKVTWLVVKEVTRGGTVVREDRFPADQVITFSKEMKEV